MIRNRSNLSSYVTRDGSRIWELFRPESSPAGGFSVAEALVGPGQATAAHVHHAAQEVYYILEGNGAMRLGEEERAVIEGDAILMMPDTLHCIRNEGAGALRILCICCPPYSHEDTELR